MEGVSFFPVRLATHRVVAVCYIYINKICIYSYVVEQSGVLNELVNDIH